MSALLEAKDVQVSYRVSGRRIDAVRGVSLNVGRGDRVGLIGESGSGKSSLARALLGLERLAGGSVTFDGQPMHGAKPALRRRFQPVFQDVGAALNPRMRLREVLAEPFVIHDRKVDDAVLSALLAQVQLSAELLTRLPHELSVGQRQRVNLARALALEPELLLLDEPVSALDVSVQAQVLNLLNALTQQRALLVITHDLDVVAHLCSRVAVMFAGRIVESGSVVDVLERPLHPYTRLLVESRQKIVEGAEAAAASTGCSFHPRCAHAIDRCRSEDPRLTGETQRSACFVFEGR
ncbi:MAG: ABC transporter ATP-binding protein [Archangium sp.]|nr:ABC transporter ATP-binding protein [Archangium sp.]MDP3570862.1 ABC transporter ATP-binding protein [Archangium sp.]